MTTKQLKLDVKVPKGSITLGKKENALNRLSECCIRHFGVYLNVMLTATAPKTLENGFYVIPGLSYVISTVAALYP